MLLIFLGICLKQAYFHYEVTTAKMDPGFLANTFIYTLKGNDEDLAKAIVSQEAWWQIDTWMKDHEAIGRCRNLKYVLLEMEATSSGSGHYLPDSTTRTYTESIHEPCPSFGKPDRWYCLTTSEIIMQYQEDTDTWVITGWGEVIERWDRAGCH